MIKFRKKQKQLYNIMKLVAIFSAFFLFAYIGAAPYIKSFNPTLSTVLSYSCDILVVIVLILVFMYYSKYGKVDTFLTAAENEINDYGYYISSREESTCKEYVSVMQNDLKQCGFSIVTSYSMDDFDVELKATKRKKFFYVAIVDDLDSNDIVAYLDSVINDIAVKNLKRKGDAVICFVTNNADDSAVALSKMITPVGKKERIKIAISIVEPKTKNTYFLGNVQTECQRMIANFVMNCDVPIKEAYIHKDKLPYQEKLAKKMESFNLNDFKSGKFYIH